MSGARNFLPQSSDKTAGDAEALVDSAGLFFGDKLRGNPLQQTVKSTMDRAVS
jgi:hypothetical protein